MKLKCYALICLLVGLAFASTSYAQDGGDIVKPVFSPKGFFTARPDFRKCIYPLCGGYFVKSVNKKKTRCADGSLQPECYVVSIEFYGTKRFGPFAPGNKNPLLLRGKIVPKEFKGFGKLGVFVAKEAFKSVTDKTAAGRFFGVQNNGIVCVTTPCFSWDQYVLNTKRINKLSGVNLDKVGADKKELEYAYKILANRGVLLGAGRNVVTKEMTGPGLHFVASQFYLPIRPFIVPLK